MSRLGGEDDEEEAREEEGRGRGGRVRSDTERRMIRKRLGERKE